MMCLSGTSKQARLSTSCTRLPAQGLLRPWFVGMNRILFLPDVEDAICWYSYLSALSHQLAVQLGFVPPTGSKLLLPNKTKYSYLSRFRSRPVGHHLLRHPSPQAPPRSKARPSFEHAYIKLMSTVDRHRTVNKFIILKSPPCSSNHSLIIYPDIIKYLRTKLSRSWALLVES